MHDRRDFKKSGEKKEGLFSRLSKRSKKTPVKEEDGLARRSVSGTTKVVEVPKGKSAQKAAPPQQQQEPAEQEQTTKVLQDVRVAIPPVRVAVEDVGMSNLVDAIVEETFFAVS